METYPSFFSIFIGTSVCTRCGYWEAADQIAQWRGFSYRSSRFFPACFPVSASSYSLAIYSIITVEGSGQEAEVHESAG